MDVRAKLVADARHMLERLEKGTITPAPARTSRPSSIYTDEALFGREKERIFRKAPLMLAASCELRRAGDYKAMDVAGVPVLLVRGQDGTVRTFLNACTHRAAKLAHGCGHAARLTCPYHAWSFRLDGALLAVASRGVFGEVDAEESRLVSFPTTERAGLIWAVLDPDASPDFDAFLGGFDKLIAQFGFENWHHFESRSLPGANWKLAFDAHLEFYHLPVLHRATFGPGMSNLAEYFFHGPHQRLGLVTNAGHVLEQDDVASLATLPEGEWPATPLLFGEWIIFPNVSINCFYKGGRGVIISQVFPGASVGESVTVQMFLHENPPAEDLVADARAMSDFLGQVVGEEDLPMSRGQQEVLESGLLPRVQFGRNEGGVQHFHEWIDRFVEAPREATLAAVMGGE
ncbi:Rieske (2Fe-2S) protein [Novosphingobium aromaticivorans DSM 12444]|uniref:Rieske (2Fe-2S) protein n=1 Tax=Novosphingobium aromaticivorans (strain ATCC 700278 / DSM 12444 / CCUG 56034 / CIP 105152 / NBRC 16084 / F199) TaxID=279238 RepID=Q2G932_NOVAD|nr:SRPBCC family protein [Novosphingobium aromaticivorans]ABD25641.1 Rieske (2Fe-2S) protein [Novosphingobium aromaticivorans DSM 12444]SCX99373.1 Phenylpropionate dioxygenase, large terminal subunit [Novosphingobium aromaticivorans]